MLHDNALWLINNFLKNAGCGCIVAMHSLSSIVSDFQRDVHIRPLAFYIVGIELLLATASEDVAFAAQPTVMQAFPFVQNVVQAFFAG